MKNLIFSSPMSDQIHLNPLKINQMSSSPKSKWIPCSLAIGCVWFSITQWGEKAVSEIWSLSGLSGWIHSLTQILWPGLRFAWKTISSGVTDPSASVLTSFVMDRVYRNGSIASVVYYVCTCRLFDTVKCARSPLSPTAHVSPVCGPWPSSAHRTICFTPYDRY